MNDKFTTTPNPDDETLARKLSQVGEQTRANSQFAAELEEKLRGAHRPKAGWFSLMLPQISPTLGWVALMVLLAVVLSWSIRSIIPAPQPAIESTPITPEPGTPTPDPNVPPEEIVTPVPTEGGYDWRDTTLYLAVPLPASPAQANLYTLVQEQPATLDSAAALASQFGIQGEIFQTPGRLPNTNGYMITDGKQRMVVLSNLSFDYYADYGTYSFMSGGKNITAEQAVPIIDGFLKSRGLNFDYELVIPHLNPGMYFVLPLSPDGKPVYHDYNIPARLEFTIDDSGSVILVTSYQKEYEVVGTYGIRSAEEAFQQVLDASNVVRNGTLEIMRSGGLSNSGFWSRSYPDNQSITLFGQPAHYPSAQPGGRPFIGIGQFTATGNTSGIENLESSTYIEAIGLFVTENGIRRFQVESWKIAEAPEAYLTGSLRREGDLTILHADDGSGDYVIEDAPSDLPVETTADTFLAVSGFLKDGRLNWTSIQYYPAGSGGGGGGGGGTGFYKLNLSGTPVPFPESTSQPGLNTDADIYTVREGDTLTTIASTYGISVDELMQANDLIEPVIYVDQQLIIFPPGAHLANPLVGRKLENLRGIFTVTIYRQPDGTENKEYSFIARDGDGVLFLILNGDNLAELEKYQHRPLNIWATIQSADRFGTLVAELERVEAPFPDLQIQVLRGTQRTEVVDGQPVDLFITEDGTTYVELNPIGELSNSILGTQGDTVIHEALAIPDEIYGSHPALRIFNSTLATNPKNGQETELPMTADQPNIVDVEQDPQSFGAPALTIEKVELVYYVPDPTYSGQDSNPGPLYLQPAWRFYGHYSDGSEASFLIQALKQELLLPELEPYTGPG